MASGRRTGGEPVAIGWIVARGQGSGRNSRVLLEAIGHGNLKQAGLPGCEAGYGRYE